MRLPLAHRLLATLAGTVWFTAMPPASVCAAEADPTAAASLVRTGRYEEAIEAARAGRTAGPGDERWWRVEAEALRALGRDSPAYATITEALLHHPGDLRLRLLAIETARFSNHESQVPRLLEELRLLALRRPGRFADEDHSVALGEAALVLGAEPRLVLENLLKRGREATPPVRDAFLAIGRLALAKQDDGLASRTFQDGVKSFPDDPDMWAGLAASFLDGDRARLVEYAGRALELNPRHTPARLLLAEHLIDSEDYEAAEAELARIDAVNPRVPEAHALRSVLAVLRHDLAAATAHRTAALAPWSANPHVDHLIGCKLSQKYRFVEGAAAQRRALEFDPEFTPARFQLAQDLLRLGREDEGWAFAAEAHRADAYHVAAFNLVQLHDRLDDFTVLTSPHFRVRMSPVEAAVYGQRALALLEEARARLVEKYGVVLETQTTIDVFPDPKDFAVRTFGMPDNPGFLGVCFGSVVTVNSPATRRANWEAVLWHEFTHVITLTLTHNRMPRWLSEGISVYEERQRDPAWGQSMSLAWRERILEGRMQPISDMSAAFLRATNGEDLQFAYFQSSLVVEFLVERFGFDNLRAVLRSLRDDADTNTALARHCAPLDELDGAFARFAHTRADALGGRFHLTRGDDPISRALAQVDPSSYHGRLDRARVAVARSEWREARELLTPLVAEGPYLPGADSAHALLARACRELGDVAAERDALTTIATHEGDALEAVMRLLALAEVEGDDAAAVRWAERWLAINPIAPTPWRALLAAHERLPAPAAAASAGQALLHLDPPDRASVHYRVARQLLAIDAEGARRHVLLALEEAPRFRAAHELLAALPEYPPAEEAKR
jgi:tetratricopeptide (TPR) repeat protein